MNERRAAAMRPVNTAAIKSTSSTKAPVRQQPPAGANRFAPQQAPEAAPVEMPACESCQGIILSADEVRRAALCWLSHMRDAVDDTVIQHADQNTFWLTVQRAAGFTDKEIFARFPPSAAHAPDDDQHQQ